MDRAASEQFHSVRPRPQEASAGFRVLFEEQFDYVWNTLRHLGIRHDDLEDLTHEVFLRVHERLDEYDGARHIRPWLFAFAFRVASGHRRLARHRLEVSAGAAEPISHDTTADERLLVREDQALFLSALDAIDLDRRAVFVLHELDEVPIPQVAEALGIPTGTAYSRLRLARQEFHQAVRRLRLARGER